MRPPTPLLLLSGAAGAGKTTLIPHLARLARGVVVLDMDDLLDDGGVLGVPIATPSAAPIWPAYNRLWHRLTVAVRRSGVPVLLLAPPPSAEGLPEVWAADAALHQALVDCAPEEHRRRLRARGWPPADIEGALLDAERARRTVQPAFRTDLDGPEGAARAIMEWAAQRIG